MTSSRFCLQRPLGEFLRAQFEQQLARARRRNLLCGRKPAESARRQRRFRHVTFRLRIAVDDRRRPRKLSSFVARSRRGFEFEKLRRGVDQRRGRLRRRGKSCCE